MSQSKHTKGYALIALLGQLQSNRQSGEEGVLFREATEHPKTGNHCTVGDLIAPAFAELEELAAVAREAIAALKAPDYDDLNAKAKALTARLELCSC